jgi:hypothetical protein
MMPSVTWLLPVKNGMPYLPAALASIATQTNKNFEVLAWDNGSTDGSVEELMRWIPSRLPGNVVTDRPAGLGASLAEMVLTTKSEFCARMDADDVNLPNRLEAQLEFLSKNPDVAAVGSQTSVIDAVGREGGRFSYLPLSHDDIVHRLLHSSWVMNHPTVLFRRMAVLSIGNYRNWNPTGEDYDLWMRLGARYKLANIGLCLLKYRVHDKGTAVVANRTGALAHIQRECFITNAPNLFGCTRREAALLQNRQIYFLLPLLLRIAQHLSRTQGGTLKSRLETESWLEAVDRLVSLKDLITLTVLLGPRRMASRATRKVGSMSANVGRA